MNAVNAACGAMVIGVRRRACRPNLHLANGKGHFVTETIVRDGLGLGEVVVSRAEGPAELHRQRIVTSCTPRSIT